MFSHRQWQDAADWLDLGHHKQVRGVGCLHPADVCAAAGSGNMFSSWLSV